MGVRRARIRDVCMLFPLGGLCADMSMGVGGVLSQRAGGWCMSACRLGLLYHDDGEVWLVPANTESFHILIN